MWLKSITARIEPAERLGKAAAIVILKESKDPAVWVANAYQWPPPSTDPGEESVAIVARKGDYPFPAGDTFALLLSGVSAIENLSAKPDILITDHPQGTMIGVVIDCPTVQFFGKTVQGTHRMSPDRAAKTMDYLLSKGFIETPA